MECKRLYTNISHAVGAVFAGFVLDSIRAMIPWLLVMSALIMADLIAGVSKSIRIGAKVSFSRAIRDTLAKSCTYFSVVVCACMIQVAGDYEGIDKGACMIVMVIEGASIFGNILRFNGYTIDMRSVLAYFLSKIVGGSAEDCKSMIHKAEDNQTSETVQQ